VFAEELEYFARFGVASGLVFRVEDLVVDVHVEDSVAAGRERQI